MTTWTPVNKSGASVEDQTLLIEGAYVLSIGDGFSLLIQEEGASTAWVPVSKNTATWTPVNKS